MEDTSVNASTNSSVAARTDVDYKALYETSEKRRKDSQAALTPTQQQLATLRAENAILRENQGPAVVNKEEQSRLEDLKYSDPEVWRTEVNQQEALQIKQREEAIATKKGEIISEMTQEEVTRRTKEFFASQPGIDPKVVINSMPPALHDLIDSGSVTLEEALQKGIDLVRGASTLSVLAPKDPNLSQVAGSKAPTDAAKQSQSNQDWGGQLL